MNPETAQNIQSQQSTPSPITGSPSSESQQSDIPQKPLTGPGSSNPNPFPQGPKLTPTPTGKSGGFRIFVILAVVIILIIYGVVGYLYFQNQKLKDGGQETGQNQTTVTPSPEFSPEQIKIHNGSVVRERPGGDIQTLVDKEKYESTGITGFARVVVSPDNGKICFESWPPAPEPALYIAGVNGSDITEVSPNRQNCTWGTDSSKVLYINSAPKSSAVNIYSYDIASKTETNLTLESIPSGVVRRFEIVGLSADKSKLICKYEDAGGVTPTASAESSGQCEINLETNEVTLL